jgi:hypothetical protein
MVIIAVLIAMTAAAILSKLSMSRGIHGSDLGWMSEQWLAEHRASRTT